MDELLTNESIFDQIKIINIKICCNSKRKCNHKIKYYNESDTTIIITCKNNQYDFYTKLCMKYNDKIFIFDVFFFKFVKNLTFLKYIKHIELINNIFERYHYDIDYIMNYLQNLNSLCINYLFDFSPELLKKIPNLHNLNCTFLTDDFSTLDYIFSKSNIYKITYRKLDSTKYTPQSIQKKLNKNYNKLKTKYINVLKETKLSADLCYYIVNDFLL